MTDVKYGRQKQDYNFTGNKQDNDYNAFNDYDHQNYKHAEETGRGLGTTVWWLAELATRRQP